MKLREALLDYVLIILLLVFGLIATIPTAKPSSHRDLNGARAGQQ